MRLNTAEGCYRSLVEEAQQSRQEIKYRVRGTVPGSLDPKPESKSHIYISYV